VSGADKKIDDFSASFLALKASFDRATEIQVLLFCSRISEDTKRLMVTDSLKLPVLPGNSTRPRCLPGTRIAIIRTILEWVTHPYNQSILWLSGLAGSGKSTIAATVADCLDEFHRLGSYIFFSRDVDDLRRPELVIRRWADGLAAFDSGIAKCLYEALQRHHISLTTHLIPSSTN